MISYKTNREIQQEQWLKNVHEFTKNQLGGDSESPETKKFHEALIKIQSSFHRGRLIFPFSPDYAKVKQIFNQEYESDPNFVGVATDEMELSSLLKLASDFKLKFRIKAGGNNVAGYCTTSDGFVIDVSEMNTIHIANDLKTVTAGPGSHMQDIVRQVQSVGRHVVSGSCPEVTMAGFMMGGGYGFLSRQFGMCCDNCIEARVMLADGSVVIANAKKNTDLFWGIRGGGGGNLGILVSATFTISQIEDVWGFVIKYEPSNSGKALEFCQNQIVHNPKFKNIGLQGILLRCKEKDSVDSTKYLTLMGMFMGTKDEGMQLLKPLLDFGDLIFNEVDTYENLNSKLLFEAFGELGAVMSDYPRFVMQAGYVSRPLESKNWQEFVDVFLNKYDVNFAYTGFEFYGGKINEFSPESNAFVHRDKDVNVFSSPVWNSDEQKEEAFKLLNELNTLVTEKNFFDGQVYQNYPRRDLKDYKKAYWGESLPKLLNLKNKIDPENLFCFGQGLNNCKK